MIIFIALFSFGVGFASALFLVAKEGKEIEAARKASAIDNLQLRKALAIAWDAFENVKATPSGGCSNSHDAYADEAMRRIEELRND